MTYSETLRELAATYAISRQYTGFGGHVVEVSDDTLLKTLDALGVDLGDRSEQALAAAITRRHDEEFARPLPRCVVATHGYPYVVNVHVVDGAPAAVTVALEGGDSVTVPQVENWTPPRTVGDVTYGEASFEIPPDLPLGWHSLTLCSDDLTATCALVVAPARLSTTQQFLNDPVAGVMAQLYSVRSTTSWGIGDFHDLGLLGTTLGAMGAGDFILINPLHAGEPIPPLEDSPYLPTTRRFTNPIYIRVEDIPEFAQLPEELREDIHEMADEFAQLNTDGALIDRNPIFAAKLAALREIHALGLSGSRAQEYEDYLQLEGDGLQQFALWCAERESAALHQENAHALPEDPQELAPFYMWLQWICDSQLAAAQQACLEAGMRLGIMADLAVGVHPGGSDAHTLANVLAPGASVGAPPDGYSQDGQDWSQPPWHPDRLAEASYHPWRDMLRTVLRHSGGIRVDHILGLFRLFWIPREQPASTGTYVNYDHNALVGILALEAERAGAVVIGEDLGTFEPWVQDFLAERGILGTSILWFESAHGGPRPQGEYRAAALSSVTTHDLPPTLGFLDGGHILLRESLGLLHTNVDDDLAEDLSWQASILECVYGGQRTFHGLAREERGKDIDLLEHLHRFIAGTPSALTCTALVDLVGDRKVQNQPGTTKELYPNWCVPLADSHGNPVLIEDLTDHPLAQRIIQASARTK